MTSIQLNSIAILAAGRGALLFNLEAIVLQSGDDDDGEDNGERSSSTPSTIMVPHLLLIFEM